MHVNEKNEVRVMILDALRSGDRKGGVSCSAEILIKAAEKLIDFFPNYDFRTVIDSLYKEVCTKKENNLKRKSNRC